jgi:hypothetical protein
MGINCLVDLDPIFADFVREINSGIFGDSIQILSLSCHNAVIKFSYYYGDEIVTVSNQGSDPCIATITEEVDGFFDTSYTIDICDYYNTNGNQDDDFYEPDDYYSQATSISISSLEQYHTLTEYDIDWFYFMAVAGNTYVIETNGNLDTQIYLYDSSGSYRIDYDDDSGIGNNARIEWTCTTSGTYYFRVEGYDSSDTGSYSVSVSNYY